MKRTPIKKARSFTVRIMVTPAEAIQLTQAAESDGLPFSTWARRILLNHINHVKGEST